VVTDFVHSGAVYRPFDLPDQAVFGRPALVLYWLTAQVDLGRVGRKPHPRTVLERVLVAPMWPDRATSEMARPDGRRRRAGRGQSSESETGGMAMPAKDIDEVLMLERQSQRLAVLWRSPGQAFRDEQAAALQEDVDRLREAYLALANSTAGPT